jgi:hypothetical protein
MQAAYFENLDIAVAVAQRAGGSPGSDHRGRALADIGICRQLPALAVVWYQRAGVMRPDRAKLLLQV